jgi:hypothetical protein
MSFSLQLEERDIGSENAYAIRRDGSYFNVIARSVSDEAIHSFFARHYGLLRFARNDGVENFVYPTGKSTAHPENQSPAPPAKIF